MTDPKSAPQLPYRSVDSRAILLGQLAESALLVFVLTRSDQAKTPAEGLKVGALVGFLMWMGADFIFYGNSNIWNLTVTALDPFLEVIRFAACGALVAMILGRRTVRTASV